ncbi:maleylpyruvate isomerase family mycothiol-dependent enzyme [Jiangella asiatica]|uniref:Maleylpyruvate isomerase family mycothiol-dependent enzyme n=1 Tax=Jiangella asiatica TaxID=2530372 RepID=A0A4R5DA29_9ACTN|nr:maleylpyruvate isomerase family mycothiol-dependent enzyme [Jiangella asiatica]
MSHDSGGEPTAGPVTAASDRLIATAATLDDAGLTAASLCPGWTRAHVLTHVARNADALTNLLTWARTGRESPMYPSREARDADIEAGADRSLEDILGDLRTTAERFVRAVMEMPDDGWERQVRRGPGATGDPLPGRRVLWLRLRELEVHHVDLDAGYTPADWPDAFVRRALGETVRAFTRRDDVPPVTLDVDGVGVEHLGAEAPVTVSGSPAALLAWLTGRSPGSDLRVDPAGGLPVLPAWL